MKKINLFAVSVLLSLIVVFFVSAAVAIDSNTNLAENRSAYGTFTNPELVTDAKNKTLAATSGDVTDTPQYLTVDLGSSVYLDRVRISWDKNAYSGSYSIRTSGDSKFWNDEASNLDAGTGIADASGNNLVQSISLKGTQNSSRFVQIMIPAGSAYTSSKGPNVKIAKVEVFPSMNQSFSISDVNVYSVTDTTAAIKYRTSIGTAGGSVFYGTDPNSLAKSSANTQSGVYNSVVVSGLKQNTTYFFQVKATDFYGKSASSSVGSFTTSGVNIALNKKVTGTFLTLPDDNYVKPGTPDQVLSRATDGVTSYFTGMADSGPVSAADQYVVVDLGRPYKLSNIISYWRSLAYPESLTIQASENNTAWTTVADGVDAGAGAFGRSDAGDPMQIVNTSVPGSIPASRYIKLLVKKGSPAFHKHAEWGYVQLMEVQAFAAK